MYWLLPDDWKTSATGGRRICCRAAPIAIRSARVSRNSAATRSIQDLHAAFVGSWAQHQELKEEFLSAVDRFRTWRQNLPERGSRRAA